MGQATKQALLCRDAGFNHLGGRHISVTLSIAGTISADRRARIAGLIGERVVVITQRDLERLLYKAGEGGDLDALLLDVSAEEMSP